MVDTLFSSSLNWCFRWKRDTRSKGNSTNFHVNVSPKNFLFRRENWSTFSAIIFYNTDEIYWGNMRICLRKFSEQKRKIALFYVVWTIQKTFGYSHDRIIPFHIEAIAEKSPNKSRDFSLRMTINSPWLCGIFILFVNVSSRCKSFAFILSLILPPIKLPSSVQGVL